MKVLLEGEESTPLTSNIVRCTKDWVSAAAASGSGVGGSGCASARHCKLLRDLIAIEDLYEDQRLQMARARCCFGIRRVMRAMVRTYQITMGRAYYKCTLGFSSTSNVTDT